MSCLKERENERASPLCRVTISLLLTSLRSFNPNPLGVGGAVIFVTFTNDGTFQFKMKPFQCHHLFPHHRKWATMMNFKQRNDRANRFYGTGNDCITDDYSEWWFMIKRTAYAALFKWFGCFSSLQWLSHYFIRGEGQFKPLRPHALFLFVFINAVDLLVYAEYLQFSSVTNLNSSWYATHEIICLLLRLCFLEMLLPQGHNLTSTCASYILHKPLQLPQFASKTPSIYHDLHT